jgi:hypothetical protein
MTGTHKSLRLVRGLNAFGRAIAARFDRGALEALMGLDDDDTLQAARHRIVEAVAAALRGEGIPANVDQLTHCPHCSAVLKAPDIAVQLDYFKLHQAQRGWSWPEVEMQKLAAALQPGDVLHPRYARSAHIRKADGALIMHECRS